EGDCPSEGVAEQLAAEQANDHVLLLRQQIGAQPIDSVELGAVPEFRAGIDGEAAKVPVASAADGVVALQGEPEWVDALVADGTLGDPRVLLDLLPRRESIAAFFLGQTRHIRRRAGELLAEQCLDHPVAAEDRAGPRRPGLL